MRKLFRLPQHVCRHLVASHHKKPLMISTIYFILTVVFLSFTFTSCFLGAFLRHEQCLLQTHRSPRKLFTEGLTTLKFLQGLFTLPLLTNLLLSSPLLPPSLSSTHRSVSSPPASHSACVLFILITHFSPLLVATNLD